MEFVVKLDLLKSGHDGKVITPSIVHVRALLEISFMERFAQIVFLVLNKEKFGCLEAN